MRPLPERADPASAGNRQVASEVGMQILRESLRADSDRITVTVEHGDELLLTLHKQAGIAADMLC